MVLDASAAPSGVLNAGPARQLLAMEPWHAPRPVDAAYVALAEALDCPW